MIKIVLLIIIAICVTIIYDARKITEKYFSSTINNKQIKLMKVVSFIIAIVAAFILYYILKK